MRASIVTAYLETLLWSECFHGQGEDGEDPLVVDGEEYAPGTPIDQIPGCDVSDLATLAPKIVKEAEEDLDGFQSYCEETLGLDPFEVFDASQVAHDFCLSRNGHGAGFFDGVYEYEGEEYSSDLQAAAKTFGTMGLSVWNEEDGTLRMESHS